MLGMSILELLLVKLAVGGVGGPEGFVPDELVAEVAPAGLWIARRGKSVSRRM